MLAGVSGHLSDAGDAGDAGATGKGTMTTLDSF